MDNRKTTPGFYLEKHTFSKVIKNNEELFLKLENTPEEEKPTIISEILENNMRTIHHILNRKYKGGAQALCQRYRMTYDELFALGYEFLWQAILRFDVHRGFKFTTLSYKMMLNGYSKYFDRLKGVAESDTSIDQNVYTSEDSKDINLLDIVSQSEDISLMITDVSFYIQLFDELEKEVKPRDMSVLRSSLSGEYTQTEMGKIYGISQVQISRIIKKVQDKAKEIRVRILDSVV